MSTSDQQEHGPLTRKQLREIRLTGSTPVITPEEAAAAAPSVPPAEPVDAPAEQVDTPAEPGDAEAEASPIPESFDGSVPLTRRQVRELERRRGGGSASADDGSDADDGQEDVEELVVVEESALGEETPAGHADAILEEPAPVEQPGSDADETTDPDAVSALGLDADAQADTDDVLADDAPDDEVIPEGERPTVSPAFGSSVLDAAEEAPKPFTPSFDELLTVGDTTGSQGLAPNALIFTQGPAEGSLSGPVASTGEVLITGSYELPQGFASQGHAHGTADGREVDAVLIDGELPPASSPTPIAASSAVSTIKPAGEVIRPPAPEKGNKLMLTLAITAGGLALALAVVLVVAFTTNVF